MVHEGSRELGEWSGNGKGACQKAGHTHWPGPVAGEGEGTMGTYYHTSQIGQRRRSTGVTAVALRIQLQGFVWNLRRSTAGGKGVVNGGVCGALASTALKGSPAAASRITLYPIT